MNQLIKSTRRGFLTAGLALLAAPAIVRASSLMPIKSWIEHPWSPQRLERALRQFVVVSTSEDGKVGFYPSLNVHSLERADSLASFEKVQGLKVGDVFTISGVFN